MRRNLQLFLYYSLVALVLLVALPYMVKEHFAGKSTYTSSNTYQRAAAAKAYQEASAAQKWLMIYIFFGLLFTMFFGKIFIEWYTSTGSFEKNKLRF